MRLVVFVLLTYRIVCDFNYIELLFIFCCKYFFYLVDFVLVITVFSLLKACPVIYVFIYFQNRKLYRGSMETKSEDWGLMLHVLWWFWISSFVLYR